MSPKQLFIFVEGANDERFFERVVKPKLQQRYNVIIIHTYAERKDKYKRINAFLQSIASLKAEYIFVTDIDNSPCITAKKEEIRNRIRDIDANRILVVVKEIESWYFAGLDNIRSKKLKIRRNFENTNNLTKEQFKALIPKSFDSEIDFMIEILNLFSIEIAKNKNDSFKYFLEKFNIQA
ncbi:DUF4276 family protein [Bacteroidetes/Chlorobi group bacterium MS-B_bin-24]|nr:MAG: DUF4276 family protein [Bacteroidetes/Chlorobi group bacterium MS-B_bin-24]